MLPCLRVALTPLLAFALLVGGAGVASAQAPLPAAPIAPAVPLACSDGIQPSGAQYRICLPASGWNGNLVVYAHGYVAPTQPVALPEDQLSVGGVSIADIVTNAGYAFAATSYRRTGLAIREGIDDLVELVGVFAQKHGDPDRVILTGVSEGGVMTVLALEERPDVFDGGLALCGPYGDFQRQVDYFADFRVVFDAFFPGLVAPTPIDIPPALLGTWETHTYSETVKPVILSPASAISLTQVLSVTAAPVDATNLVTTSEQTVERLLWYNVYSTNDGKTQLGGNPFGNTARTYAGSLDDPALNFRAFRATADITATTAISAGYQTTGRLTVPLYTMHTTLDPVIPYWQADLYAQKVAATGSTFFYQHQKVNAYGHCAFQPFELLGAFNTLATRVNTRSIFLPVIVK